MGFGFNGSLPVILESISDPNLKRDFFSRLLPHHHHPQNPNYSHLQRVSNFIIQLLSLSNQMRKSLRTYLCVFSLLLSPRHHIFVLSVKQSHMQRRFPHLLSDLSPHSSPSLNCSHLSTHHHHQLRPTIIGCSREVESSSRWETGALSDNDYNSDFCNACRNKRLMKLTGCLNFWLRSNPTGS